MKKKILYVLILGLTALNIYQYSSKRPVDNFSASDNPYNTYTFTGNLTCVIKESTESGNVGDEFSLIDLDTDKPRLLTENGTFPLSVMNEDANDLTVGLIADVGSTDIFVLDKEKGEFARTASGNVGGVYAYAYKGFCK